jgi:hypothetical protein
MLAVAIMFRLMHSWPESRPLSVGVTFSLARDGLCGHIRHTLREGNYWVAEKMLEVYFQVVQVDRKRGRHRGIPYRDLKEAAELVLNFTYNFEQEHCSWFSDGEQERWAKITILQTFCEGVQNWGALADQSHHDPSWSFSRVKHRLRELVHRTLQADDRKSGEWRRSRGFIRQQLIELDEDDVPNGANSESKRYNSLLELQRHADANGDSMMALSIHRTKQLFDAATIGSRFARYPVYAQDSKKIERTGRMGGPARTGGVKPSFQHGDEVRLGNLAGKWFLVVVIVGVIIAVGVSVPLSIEAARNST